MAFYYDINYTKATVAGAATEDDSGRLLTTAARTAAVSRLIGGTAGAAQDNQCMLKLWRMSVASTTGTAFVPQVHDPLAPAAVTTPFTNAVTIGTKNTNAALILPFNSRAMVQWVALNPDEVHYLSANGGANGNIDILTEQAAGVAVTMRIGLTFYE